jgi:hypothetical protein
MLAIMKRASWLLFLMVVVACAKGAVETVMWRGDEFRELRTLQELPLSIQNALGVGRVGLEGIADAGGRFNVTDVVDSALPMKRFTVAGISSKQVLVVIEQGGRGHYFEVLLFELPNQEKQKWTLFEKPAGLRGLIESLSAKQ